MEWVKLSAVIRALHAANSGMTPARPTVCQRAAAGLLRARADAVFRGGVQLDGDTIPKEFWAGGPNSISGDWGTGDLRARTPRDSRSMSFVNWEVFGIQFLREDAEKMGVDFNQAVQATPADDHVTPPVDVPANRRKGRTPDKKDWTNFCAALAVVATLDDDGVQVGTSALKIYDKAAQVLQAHLGPDADYLSYDSVRDAITTAQDWISRGMPSK